MIEIKQSSHKKAKDAQSLDGGGQSKFRPESIYKAWEEGHWGDNKLHLPT